MAKQALSPLTYPVLRLTRAQYEAIHVGQPIEIMERPAGFRWRDFCWGGARIREFCGAGPDGSIINTYRPVIRVAAVSRLVPRPAFLA